MKKTIFLWLLILAACTSRVDVSVPVIKVSLPSSEASRLLLSDIASSVECFPLATSDSTLIADPVQIVVQDGFAYVADHTALYKYDLSGTLQASVKRRGNGPEEYLSVSDMQLDKDGTPWVLCRNGKALYHYSWEGALLEKVKLDAWVSRIRLIEGKMLLFVGNEKDEANAHQLKLLDLQTGSVEGKFLPMDDHKSVYLHVQAPNHFSYSDGQLCFYQMFCDTVYVLSPEGRCIPKCVAGFAGKNIPSSFYAGNYQDVMDFFQHLLPEDYAYGLGMYLEKQGVQWLSYVYGGQVCWSVTSAGGAEKVAEGRSAAVLIDDVCLESYPIVLGEVNCFVQDEGSVVIPLSPYEVIEYAEKALDASACRSLRERLHYVGEEQNPVLLKIGM